MKRVTTVLLLAFPLFCGCLDTGVKSIEREELFSLNIGLMEDQIALYKQGEGGIGRSPGFAMREGFFYIADSTAGKIVRYNSYGDLLFMIYNEETNPTPVSMKNKSDGNSYATRWAFSYPLREPGVITVDSAKHFFVEDKLPYDRYGFDESSRALLDRIVLHFDADGRFIEYLGREGVGGSPFPLITGLYTSAHDELAVVCRLPTGWHIYWFDSGNLIFLVQLNNSSIPKPPDWPALSASVDSVMAAPDSRNLYVKVDYYHSTLDSSTNTHTGTEAYGSLVWILNVEDGTYSSPVTLPFYETAISEKGRSINIRMPYSMLGILKNGKFVMYYPEDEGYSILFLNANSQERRKGFINIDPSGLQFSVFNLSSEGLLSAMLIKDWQVSLAWWRTDRLMGETP
jgi:hypothetical protein